MRILLISANRERSPYPVAPLGLAYIAAALKEDGHEVALLDLCFEEDGVGAALKAAENHHAELIGLSIRNVDNLTFPKSIFYYPQIKSVVEGLRTGLSSPGSDSRIPVVLGGSGFSLFPEETLSYMNVDYGIVGEGEDAMRGLVACLGEGGKLSEIPNLIYKDAEGFVENQRVFSESFCKVRPARELISSERYFAEGGMANIQTKRGCPFTCTYCTYPQLEGERLRLREPREIVDELEFIITEYGIDYVFFVDDIFNVPQNHAKEICEEIIRRALVVKWTCFATPREMSLELATLMRRAGCVGVEFGTDGGVDATMEAMSKGFTQDDVARAQEVCDEAGLEAAHYLILGGPAETAETLRATYAFMERIKPRAVIVMLGVRIYPATGLALRATAEGIIKKGESLLEPKFYISKQVREILIESVETYARTRPNWIVPGIELRSSEDLSRTLRLMGHKGVLWDMLEK
jgi:radical SAM superfamily enzyme YgiQ (UPF0313 family)